MPRLSAGGQAVTEIVFAPGPQPEPAFYPEFDQLLDDRTAEILERRRRTAVVHRRGWLLRRMLLAADLVGLAAAFGVVQLAFGVRAWPALFFACALPLWIVLAKIYGLYDRDEERTEHTMVDDVVGVFHCVTTGVWIGFAIFTLAGVEGVTAERLFVFWGSSLLLVTFGRSAARALSHKSLTFLQNTVIVGAGDVGQLVARKLLHHPEYGINLVGFVDDYPKDPAIRIWRTRPLLGGRDRAPRDRPASSHRPRHRRLLERVAR